jgi:hypothetical protein
MKVCSLQLTFMGSEYKIIGSNIQGLEYKVVGFRVRFMLIRGSRKRNEVYSFILQPIIYKLGFGV